MRFANGSRPQTRNLSTHMATQHGNIHAAIPPADLQLGIQQPHRTTYTPRTTSLQNTEATRNQCTHQNDRPAAAAHTRYLSSPAGATLHGKTSRFRAQTTSHNKAPATSMLPLQCVLQSARTLTRISLCTLATQPWQHSCSPFHVRSATQEFQHHRI